MGTTRKLMSMAMGPSTSRAVQVGQAVAATMLSCVLAGMGSSISGALHLYHVGMGGLQAGIDLPSRSWQTVVLASSWSALPTAFSLIVGIGAVVLPRWYVGVRPTDGLNVLARCITLGIMATALLGAAGNILTLIADAHLGTLALNAGDEVSDLLANLLVLGLGVATTVMWRRSHDDLPGEQTPLGAAAKPAEPRLVATEHDQELWRPPAT